MIQDNCLHNSRRFFFIFLPTQRGKWSSKMLLLAELKGVFLDLGFCCLPFQGGYLGVCGAFPFCLTSLDPPLFRSSAHPDSKSSKVEDLGFVKPLWRIVVASCGSKFSKAENFGFGRIVVASGGSKSSKLKILDL